MSPFCMCAGEEVMTYSPTFAPLYRYYGHGDHFYTTNINEIGECKRGEIGEHGYQSEGIAAIVHAGHVPGAVPLYRYYKSQNHFYTTNSHEIGVTKPDSIGRYGYKCEGIAGYVFPDPTWDTVPLHRYYKEGSNDDHFYTLNTNEIGSHLDVGQIGRHGYKYEGVACYVYKPGV